MYIITLKYIKSLEEVEKELEAHIKYLEKYYAMDKFICSGRKNPRIGGVIISKGKNREEIESIIEEDPFKVNKIAEYEIIEFMPTKHVEGLEKYIM
jgi:uncharacterized protein YciI